MRCLRERKHTTIGLRTKFPLQEELPLPHVVAINCMTLRDPKEVYQRVSRINRRCFLVRFFLQLFADGLQEFVFKMMLLEMMEKKISVFGAPFFLAISCFRPDLAYCVSLAGLP